MRACGARGNCVPALTRVSSTLQSFNMPYWTRGFICVGVTYLAPPGLDNHMLDYVKTWALTPERESDMRELGRRLDAIAPSSFRAVRSVKGLVARLGGSLVSTKKDLNAFAVRAAVLGILWWLYDMHEGAYIFFAAAAETFATYLALELEAPDPEGDYRESIAIQIRVCDRMAADCVMRLLDKDAHTHMFTANKFEAAVKFRYEKLKYKDVKIASMPSILGLIAMKKRAALIAKPYIDRPGVFVGYKDYVATLATAAPTSPVM